MALKLHRWIPLYGLLVILFLGQQSVQADEFPSIESLPVHAEFPDPLVMLDGTRIKTPGDWFSKRRPELVKLFQHYMYGFLPPKPRQTIVEQVLFTDDQFLDGKATISETRLAFFGPDLKQRLHVLLILPRERKGQVPVFVSMNFCGNFALVKHPQVHVQDSWVYKSCGGNVNERATDAGRGTQMHDWNIDLIIQRGYGFASFCSGDIDPDTPEFSDGIEPAFYAPGQTSPKPDDAGAIAAWAWGFHRVVDFLTTQHTQTVDPKRLISVGHSRNGKTALLAAAMDERIALAIPHQAGCGGSAPSRPAMNAGRVEILERINTAFPHWFCDNFALFNQSRDKLPFDQHCLVALCAPRPVLFTNAIQDTWANPGGQFDILQAATPVYQLLNAGGLEATGRPEPGKLISSRLGYYLRPGTHSMTREDWGVFLDFADKQLGKP